MSSRKEALFNEFKGNLYEFLVASSIARKSGIESKFYQNLNLDMRKMLEYQESFLRDFYPQLLVQLPKLADGLVDELLSKLSYIKIEDIFLIGKVALASHDDEHGEGDLLIKYDDTSLPISLKLGKSNSYLNTKSAGVKSFISKYFSTFKESEERQNKYAHSFDKNYHIMTLKLHEINGIDYTQSFKSWVDAGLPELPGSLEGDSKKAYLGFTRSISNELYKLINEFLIQDEKKFMDALFPILGFSKNNVLQATTYYKNKNDSYILDAHRIDNLKADIRIKEIINKEDVSYFEIRLEDRVLQIRIKAINKFTHPSFKINCSVKYID